MHRHGRPGPALLVNDRAIGRLDPQRVSEICDLILHDTPLAAWPPELFAIDDNIRRADALLTRTLPRLGAGRGDGAGARGLAGPGAGPRLRGRGGRALPRR